MSSLWSYPVQGERDRGQLNLNNNTDQRFLSTANKCTSSAGYLYGFVTSAAAPDCYWVERPNEPIPGWDSHPLEINVLFTAHS